MIARAPYLVRHAAAATQFVKASLQFHQFLLSLPSTESIKELTRFHQIIFVSNPYEPSTTRAIFINKYISVNICASNIFFFSVYSRILMETRPTLGIRFVVAVSLMFYA